MSTTSNGPDTISFGTRRSQLSRIWKNHRREVLLLSGATLLLVAALIMMLVGSSDTSASSVNHASRTIPASNFYRQVRVPNTQACRALAASFYDLTDQTFEVDPTPEGTACSTKTMDDVQLYLSVINTAQSNTDYQSDAIGFITNPEIGCSNATPYTMIGFPYNPKKELKAWDVCALANTSEHPMLQNTTGEKIVFEDRYGHTVIFEIDWPIGHSSFDVRSLATGIVDKYLSKHVG